MELKTDNKGYSFVELLLILSVIIVAFTFVVMFIHPPNKQKKARDTVRLSDAIVLSRAVEEYNLDNGSLPDTDNTLRVSNTLPVGNTGPLEGISGNGWIDATFTGYLTKLPIDPVNTGSFIYSYKRNGTVYEINMVLENSSSEMQNDGGNNSNVYELGSSLTLVN